jgi:hypothetical protein
VGDGPNLAVSLIPAAYGTSLVIHPRCEIMHGSLAPSCALLCADLERNFAENCELSPWNVANDKSGDTLIRK